jgi:hypothetical protein
MSASLIAGLVKRLGPDVRRARPQISSPPRGIHALVTPIIWKEITTQFKGRPIRGSYAVEDGMVKVRTLHGEKATQLRGTNAIWLAGRLLRELAAEGKA